MPDQVEVGSNVESCGSKAENETRHEVVPREALVQVEALMQQEFPTRFLTHLLDLDFVGVSLQPCNFYAIFPTARSHFSPWLELRQCLPGAFSPQSNVPLLPWKLNTLNNELCNLSLKD